MIRVMIADDNAALNKLYCNYLSKDENIQVVYISTDGKETLEKYQEIHPDVLLLDLNLPSMSGLDIINNLCLDTEERKICNIIIISGNGLLRYNLFNTSKIFRIMPKPVEFQDIIDTIKEVPLDNNNQSISEKNIRNFLFSLNFNVYSDGTLFLIEAILMAYRDPNLLKNIKDIYTIISNKHSIPYNTVKWGIRNSIDTMNKNTTCEELNSKLQVPYCRKLTPKYFIPLVISHFEN